MLFQFIWRSYLSNYVFMFPIFIAQHFIPGTSTLHLSRFHLMLSLQKYTRRLLNQNGEKML